MQVYLFYFKLCTFLNIWIRNFLKRGRKRLTIAASQVRVYILRRLHLKANYVTMLHEGISNLKALPSAAHKCCLLFSLFGGCTTTIFHGLTYPKILCAAEKRRKKEREKMATSRDVDGWQKSWHNGKGGNIWWRNQEMLRRLDSPI